MSWSSRARKQDTDWFLTAPLRERNLLTRLEYYDAAQYVYNFWESAISLSVTNFSAWKAQRSTVRLRLTVCAYLQRRIYIFQIIKVYNNRVEAGEIKDINRLRKALGNLSQGSTNGVVPSSACLVYTIIALEVYVYNIRNNPSVITRYISEFIYLCIMKSTTSNQHRKLNVESKRM